MSYEYVHKPKVRYVYISVFDRLGGKLIERLSYKDLPMNMAIKWGWYFKYRHALFQVKYPKGYVETVHHNVEPEGRTLEMIEADRKRKEAITCKRMITKISKAVNKFEKIENESLFPNFNDKNYIKAKNKLKNYKSRLELLQLEM